MPTTHAHTSNSSYSFLDSLSNDPNVQQLLSNASRSHQTTLIHHDYDTIYNPSLINQLLTTNPLTIAIHNTRNLSDSTKYNQVLETMLNKNIDFLGVTETCHPKGQRFKAPSNLHYTAFWSNIVNKKAGVGLILHRKWSPYIR